MTGQAQWTPALPEDPEECRRVRIRLVVLALVGGVALLVSVFTW